MKVKAMFLTVGVLVVLLAPAVAQAAPPTCNAWFGTLAPGQRKALPADACIDPDAGDSFQLTLVVPPSHGTLVEENGTYFYTPAVGYHGVDEFTFRATDTHGETSNTGLVHLLIDTAPTCRDESVTITSGTRLIVNGLQCDDADNDVIDVYLDDPQHGTLVFAPDGSGATYTPAAGFLGVDAMTYSARDPFGLTSGEAMLAITVIAPPPAPPAPPAAPPPAAKPADAIAPHLSLLSAKTSLRDARMKGVSVVIRTDEAGTVGVTLTVDRATARKLKLIRNPRGIVKVGSSKGTVSSGRSTVVVKLNAKLRRALATAHSVRLRVTVVIADAAGNRAMRTMTITLRRT